MHLHAFIFQRGLRRAANAMFTRRNPGVATAYILCKRHALIFFLGMNNLEGKISPEIRDCGFCEA
jgi:hypothetical protein